MSGLRSAIDDLLSVDLVCLSDAEITDEAGEVSRALGLLTHRLADLAAECELRGSFRTAGFVTPTQWLAAIGDMDASIARHHLGLGRTLRRHQETGRRAEKGELSRARVRHLARAARRYPDLYGEHEELLLELADTMELGDFKKAIDHWINLADDTAAEAENRKQEDQTRLHASQTTNGMLKLDGLFDKESGEVILTALNAAMTPEARKEGSSGELRPASQRRADALHHICRQYLDHHPGRIGGNRPHVSLIMDLGTLERRAGWRCELDHTGTITPETARRLLCDAELSWLIVNEETEPLCMGRSVRTATPAQMRALAVRDGGCTWKGCDRPPSWCDAHHDIPWEKGGRTDITHLRLLCRRHHIMIHRWMDDESGSYPDEWRPSIDEPRRTTARKMAEAVGAGSQARAP